MTLQMHYEEKYEQGLAQGIQQGLQQGETETAIRMIEDGKLSIDEIARYSGLTPEQVKELAENRFIKS